MIACKPFGVAALLLELAEHPDAELPSRIARLGERIRQRFGAAVTDLVAGWTSLLVHYDPRQLTLAELQAGLEPLLADWPGAAQAGESGRLHEVPTLYAGPDLAEVAERCGLSEAEVIARHCGRDYQVGAIGFMPGFAFLGELDERLALPRRSTPRTAVPAGSLAIAERQTAVYPQASPGGWNLIGRCLWTVFDARAEPPCLLAPGDRVRFVPVDEAAFRAQGGQP
ncbi:5-oxoprolinase subunit PxpB [Pseudomonas sp. PLB05]|uniref:5-oxoprolinase subunit PxpB n=1 Tax=Pseudomonas sp. PLB05 TaxID=2899078 RepID=UPI001E61FE79|nr:5-oxoprolinase subunit PxpB [Pseudomonas sp. PLB05]MCD4866015.1 5-oxoprolinase subunit PxpB [Pseudomonas sp. PLB05]